MSQPGTADVFPVSLQTPFLSFFAIRFVTAELAPALVAVVVSIFLLVASVGNAIERWTASRYPSATLVLAGSLDDPDRRELLSPRTIEVIRATPGVDAVDEQYRHLATILFR